ncbi:MAG: septum formation protein Maf [Alphaproteobacteria bacterium]|nr:septum formation protein Maf [Alphaproteobacteria bacterium]
MSITCHTPLILASGSAIRQQMLKEVGLRFSVLPSGVDEEALKPTLAHLHVAQKAIELAKAKALWVSEKNPDALTIGADQICSLNGTIFDKPGSHEKAELQLAALAGHSHTQTNGLIIAKGSKILWEHTAQATLTVRPLTPAEIKAYIAADAPLSSCGAYKLESLGRHLFSNIEGDHDVVKGLALVPLLTELQRIGAISLV